MMTTMMMAMAYFDIIRSRDKANWSNFKQAENKQSVSRNI